MDVTQYAEPSSDELSAVDFLDGPREFVIAGAKKGKRGDKEVVDVALVGERRVWRPGKGMIRLLKRAWGNETNVWIGRRCLLYNDPSVMYGNKKTGGVRISALSHTQKFTLNLVVSQGRYADFTVESLPDLPDAPPPITPETVTEFEARIQAATTPADLNAIRDDLKAFDLGTHRKPLGQLWSDRKNAIEAGSEK